MEEEEEKKKVLVVEDTKDHAELIKLKLIEQGYQVEVVESGEDALSLPHLSSFYAIVCDFLLPKMNGIEFLIELKKRNVDVPVIVMTAHGDEQTVVRAMKEGAYDYIVKEVDFNFLELLPPVIEEARGKYLLTRQNTELTKKLKEKTERLTELTKELKRLSITDPLTNIYNRRFFFEALKLEFNRASRYLQPLALIILDLDDFKKINDTYGHLAGDKILAEVASILVNGVRQGDVLARYGGDEFALLLPATELENGLKVALRLKKKVTEHCFFIKQKKLTLTLSAGVVATDDFSAKTAEGLLEEGDKRLLAAKKRGKDQIFPPYKPSS